MMRITDDGMVYEVADVKFSNGLELKGCEMHGLTCVTSEAVGMNDLAGGLRRVEVKDADSGEVREYVDLWLDGVRGVRGGRTAIDLRELGYAEREALKLRSDVEYLAMMTGVEL